MKPPEIQDYQFGRMVVDGNQHAQDLILLPDQVIANWWRKTGHKLDIEDLQKVLDTAPEVLVVGTGAHGMMDVPPETRQAVETAGIELQAAPTGEAWQMYNDLREQRRTVGAFHLTC
ncbi:MAG: hypothetical protein GY832_04440 [Chloroflexi bacterium]|nr:hypothetical protein [Chloroflexota bacterium]